MKLTEFINQLQSLIAEDPSVADLEVYTWMETQESWDAVQLAEDYDGSEDDTFFQGEVVGVVIQADIDKDGYDIGSYIAIRSIFLSEDEQ